MEKSYLPVCIALQILLFMAMALNPCIADGGFFSSYGADIWEPSQKAVIVYDKGVETIILQAEYRGKSAIEDFAWVVPVPSLPRLSPGDDGIFFQLHEMTKPEEKERWLEFNGCFWAGEEETDDAGYEYGGVDVINTETVGIYETTTLSATNPNSLTDWLNEHGYHIPSIREYIIKSYVDKGWYFIAMKIQPSAYYSDIGRHGGIQPIVIEFSTPQMVYPMRITAISSDYTELLLYIFAQHKMQFPISKIEFAGWIESKTLRGISSFPGRVNNKMYLTKLRAHLDRHEMDDIYPYRAASDEPYRRVIYVTSHSPKIDVCLVACVAVLLVMRKREKCRSREERYR